MNCQHCRRPRHPRVYQNGVDSSGNKIIVDESGVGGRQTEPGECNRRSAAGLHECMKIELEFLREVRAGQAKTITKLHDDNQVLKKTVADMTVDLKKAEEREKCPLVKVPEFDWVAHAAEELKYWISRTFGIKIWSDTTERCTRILEEVIELAQAHSLPKELVYKLTERVYSREVGDQRQETAGVFTTLVAYAGATGTSLKEVTEAQMNVLRTTPVQHFRNKQLAKHADGVALSPEPAIGDV